jgi:anti-anti-sigma factor
MRIHWALDGSAAILRPHGGLLGGPETDDLLAAAREARARGGRSLLVDLLEVPLVNSLGLGALVRLHRAWQAGGGEVVLCNLTRRPHTMMEITRLAFEFDIHESERAALGWMAARMAEAAEA